MKITSPYRKGVSDTSQWLKGQLHLHTTHSDGADAPADVVRDYEKRGYDFIAITDHNTTPPPQKLAGISTRMVVIPGQEYRCAKSSGDQELGVIGVDSELPDGLDHEPYLDAAVGSGGFVIFNHPTWHIHHWPIFKMLKLRRAHALEVYNAVCLGMPGTAECPDKWDRLLTCGYRIRGVATDDAHTAAHRDRGWVAVDAEPNREAIIAALKAGRFYASSGVNIDRIQLEDNTLTVESSGAQEIRFFADRGCIRHAQMGPCASYEIRDEDIFVRAQLYGPGASKAWTQPVFVESERSHRLADEFHQWYLSQQSQIAEW